MLPLDNSTTNVDGTGSSEMKPLKGGDCLRVRITNKIDGVSWVAEILHDYVKAHAMNRVEGIFEVYACIVNNLMCIWHLQVP